MNQTIRPKQPSAETPAEAALAEYLLFLTGDRHKTAAAMERLLRYRDLVLEWNNKVNMTTITNPDEFLRKHFIDSLTCAESPEYQAAGKILDLGTGAGFPGIPLALLSPEKEFLLLDSLNKRVRIVAELADSIGLENVKLIHGRAEDLARDSSLREQFDLCVSRAVANLSTLLELCLPFVKIGGAFIAYKGPDSDVEIEAATRAANRLGAQLSRIEHPNPPGFESGHTLVHYAKTRKTPIAYPRKAGTPSREPLK